MFWMENHIAAQMYGFIAMLMTLMAFLQKDDTFTKKLMMVSVFFWGIYYILLWMMSGLIVIIIWYIRMLLSIKYNKNKYILIFVLVITIFAWYYTYTDMVSLLPIIASLYATYAFFYLERLRLRASLVWISFIWLIYHIKMGAIAGILNEIMVQIVLMITIYRMIHLEWGMTYYSKKIADIIWKRSKPDYDRYIFVRDRVFNLRKTIWHYCLEILHYDLRRFLPKKNWFNWKMFWNK